MVDVGLTSGLKDLWRADSLHDLTLQIGEREFKAHKVILVAVSDYFKAMFNDGMQESQLDVIKLKDLNPDVFQKLMNLVYTGDEDILLKDTKNLLEMAVYFQMPMIIQACSEIMLKELTVENCASLVSLFSSMAVDKIKEVQAFGKAHCKAIVEHYGLDDLPYELLSVVLDNWQDSEWDAFTLVKNWMFSDTEPRKDKLDDLMRRVRFSLMSKKKLQSIKELYMYRNSAEGSWRSLINKGLKYHKMPINLKVLETSLQSQLREDPTPFFISTGEFTDPANCHYIDKNGAWTEHMTSWSPPIDIEMYPVGVKINNYFMLICDTACHIFNPRSLAWSEVDELPVPKHWFTLLHHGEEVYMFGGMKGRITDFNGSITRTTEVYNLRTNTWQSVKGLPKENTFPGACTIDNTVYVYGGRDGDFYSKDLASESARWVKRPSRGIWSKPYTVIHAIKIENEVGPLLIDQVQEVHYFSPSQNQWTSITPKFSSQIHRMFDVIPSTVEFAVGNSVYQLNANGMREESTDGLCLVWKLPEEGMKAEEEVLNKFPLPSTNHLHDRSVFGAMLAIPANK